MARKEISQYSQEYREAAIGHNTHRTWDNQYYYYDHADVHDDGMDYLQQEGVLSTSGSLNEDTAEDLSVYFAYRNFGEDQMRKFFDENGENYIDNEGRCVGYRWSEERGAEIIVDTFSAYQNSDQPETDKTKDSKGFIQYALKNLQFQFKHECYASEQEYRFVFYLPDKKPEACWHNGHWRCKGFLPVWSPEDFFCC